MTTDPTSGGDGRERLGPDPATEVRPATIDRRRARRRHAAFGGRILVGSLSASAALGLMGAMAAHATSSATDPAPAAANPPAATAVVIRRLAIPTADATRSAPPVVATVAAPVATSGGS